MDPSRVIFYTAMSDGKVDPTAVRTYGYMGEVPLEFLCDLMSELATRYWQTVLGPVQHMNLPPHG